MISKDQNPIDRSPNDKTNPQFLSRRKIKIAIISGLLLFVVLPVSSVLTIVFLVQPVVVDGNSMATTINKGDRVFVEKSFLKINRGDIVAFWYPKDTTKTFLKRVIGLPNDVILIRDGKVSVN